jgi:hypothetical protein
MVQGPLVRYSAGAHPSRVPTAVLVHGILGRRQNMRSFAQRIVEGFPHWQVRVSRVYFAGRWLCSADATAVRCWCEAILLRLLCLPIPQLPP